MKRKNGVTRGWMLVMLILVGTMPVAAQQCTPEGNWLGVISGSGGSIRVGMHVEKKGDGWKGFLNSPDQSKDTFSLEEVRWTGDSLLVRAKKIKARFSARMNSTCDTLRGTWRQNGALTLAMHRVDVLPVMERPQEPKPPFPYTIKEVEFTNPRAKITLSGTLTLPEGSGPFPAVVLVSGSGAQDRDETVAAHKPFWVLADYLSRNGIAVLRYDDRGTGKSQGNYQQSGLSDFIEDAAAAWKFLQAQPGIEPSKVGMIGHSEGGMVAPVVASRNPKLAFIVLLAGPGTSGKQILLSQGALIARAEGTPEEEIRRSLAVSETYLTIIETEKNPDKMEERIRSELKVLAANYTKEEGEAGGLSEANINAAAYSARSAWFPEFVRFKPEDYLRKVKCPVLALNGENDLQVPCKENLEAIGSALEAGRNPHYEVQSLPGLNHLFQHSATGRISEYSSLPETFAPEALTILGAWIQRTVQPK